MSVVEVPIYVSENILKVWTATFFSKKYMWNFGNHYCEVIMGALESQITSLTIVYSIVHSAADQRNHQSSAPLTFVRGIHWWSVNSMQKGPVTRKTFPFDDVIMISVPADGLITLSPSAEIFRHTKYIHKCIAPSCLFSTQVRGDGTWPLITHLFPLISRFYVTTYQWKLHLFMNIIAIYLVGCIFLSTFLSISGVCHGFIMGGMWVSNSL